MKNLITGVSGFIGKHLAVFLQKSHEIWGVCRPGSTCSDLSEIKCIFHDLTQPINLEAWANDIETIIHLAQSRRYREFPEGATDIFDVNIRSTFDLLEYARKTGVKSFVYASSGGIYGTGNHKFVEDDIIPADLANFYLTSKHIGETLVRSYSQFFRVVILRLFFPYGPGQQKSMLIPRLVENVRNGRPITLHGSDGLKINPIYIDDVVRTISELLNRKDSMTINLAGTEILSLRRIGEIIGEVLGKAPLFEVVPPKNKEAIVGDITRLSSVLRSQPTTSFFEGISRLIGYENNKGV